MVYTGIFYSSYTNESILMNLSKHSESVYLLSSLNIMLKGKICSQDKITKV